MYEMLEELIERFAGFDFESAMGEILRWQCELGNDMDDEITYMVLETVKDIIVDNCIFE